MRLHAFFRIAALVLGVSALGVASAVAQQLTGPEQQRSRIPEIRNPGGIVDDYTVTSVGRILTDMQLPWTVETLNRGQKVVAANVYGIQVLLAPGQCNRGGKASCTDIQILSLFEFDDQPVSPVLASRFNNDFPFGYVGLSSGNGIFFRRYDYEETGFARSHLRHGILSFRGFAEDFFQSFQLTLSDAGAPAQDPAEPPVSLRPGSAQEAPKTGKVEPFSFGGSGGQALDLNQLIEDAQAKENLINKVR